MTALKKLIRHKTFLLLSACLVVGLSATSTHAGFEWVPQKKQDIPPPVIQETDIPPYVPLQPLPADDVILPLPNEADLLPPMAAPAPVMVSPMPAPAPMPVPTQPLPVVAAPAPVVPIPVMAPPPQAIIEAPVPARVAIMPNEAPNSGVVVHSAPVPALPPLEAPAPIVTVPPPPPVVMTEAELVKPPMPADRSNMRIVMPDDAPQSALDKKDAIFISEFPSQQQLIQTQAIPMPSVDDLPVINHPTTGNPALNSAPIVPMSQDTSMFAEAVGFASDVPLALALRQVVPPEYAFSFNGNVNPGARVSWNGGRPWNEVVAQMIEPLGYAVHLSHKKIIITSDTNTPVFEAVPAPVIVPTAPAVVAPPLVAPTAPLPHLPPPLLAEPVSPRAELAPLPPPVAPSAPAQPVPVAPEHPAPLPPFFVEPAAGTEGSIRDNLSPDLAIVDSPVKPADENTLVISSKDAPLPMTHVERKRNIKRVNITDPGAAVVQGNQAPIKIASAPVSVSSNTLQQYTSASAASAPKLSFWTATKGASLKDTLISWSEAVGAELVWDATYDFQLSSDFEVQGSFEKAVDLLLKHGVAGSNSLDYSYVASSKSDSVKVVIADKA